MRRRHIAALAIACVALAAGCGGAYATGRSDGPSAGPATEDGGAPTEIAYPRLDRPETVLRDTFDDDRNGWGGSYQTFTDGAYVWELPRGASDQRAADALIAIEDQLAQIQISTTFVARGAAAVGTTCAFEEVDGSSRWYSLELGVDGAVIRRRPLGDGPVEILARSGDVVLTDERTTIEAICVLDDGRYDLGFAVDGDPVLTATDDAPFGPGAPDLVVRAAQDDRADQPTVEFDDVQVRVPDGGPQLDAE